ncbi:hypothetical protein VA596_44930 [Amycolatopsis sp., V23-08]|uniref:Uncharacterized protein n=1 Tax=Amycolatopsis heterodermiae TaxID=3110235 RepID=A0ABU5RKC3_9PSEU|nr:hypothetical protein [Amycolatopsis sp., V23-08]MEA5366743.1 hypothetical protein [Amycolatopsis sp., V23-08]
MDDGPGTEDALQDSARTTWRVTALVCIAPQDGFLFPDKEFLDP